jgi:hypothetical protein
LQIKQTIGILNQGDAIYLQKIIKSGKWKDQLPVFSAKRNCLKPEEQSYEPVFIAGRNIIRHIPAPTGITFVIRAGPRQ